MAYTKWKRKNCKIWTITRHFLTNMIYAYVYLVVTSLYITCSSTLHENELNTHKTEGRYSQVILFIRKIAD